LASNDQKGFTLVEVIIASVIIFAAIGIGAISYRLAVKSTESVSGHLYIAKTLPFIVDLVKKELFAGKTRGTAQFDRYISYSFTAKEQKRAKNLISQSHELQPGPEYGLFNILLVDVHLNIKYNGGTYSKNSFYDYQEIIWFK